MAKAQMPEGQKRIHDGNWNNLHQAWQPDGSVIVTLSKEDEDDEYQVHIENLWGKDERVRSHQKSLKSEKRY